MLDDRDDHGAWLLHGSGRDRDLRWRGRGGRLAGEESLGEAGESPRHPERCANAAGGDEPDQPQGAIATVPLAAVHQSSGLGDPEGRGDWEGLGDCEGLSVGFAVGCVRRTGGAVA
jgi:hypothetical protein